MSAEQNLETARQMYQAFGRGDVQAILDLSPTTSTRPPTRPSCQRRGTALGTPHGHRLPRELRTALGKLGPDRPAA